MAERIEDRLARRGGAHELLRLPAALFGGLARLRSFGYDHRLLRSYRVDVPVVSVGNLSAGGTGKTPFVSWLADWFAARDRRAGLLARGYRAVGDALNDEGQLLAERHPDLPQVQQADRVAGAARLCDLGVDVIVLDDGFQHRRLVRDLDLVLIDATRPFGLPSEPDGGEVRALLPRGLLREPPSALRRAHALVLTRADHLDEAALARLEAELESLVPGTPRVRTTHRPARLRRLGARPVDDELEALETLAGAEVELLSGIGHPAAFERTIESLGARVHAHRRLPDHHAHSAGDLAGLGLERPLVVTAKDAVKLRAARAPAQRVLVLDIDVRIERGLGVLEALLEALPEPPARGERAALHAGLSG